MNSALEIDLIISVVGLRTGLSICNKSSGVAFILYSLAVIDTRCIILGFSLYETECIFVFPSF